MNEEIDEPINIPDLNEEYDTEASIRRKQLEKMAKEKPDEFAKLLRTWLQKIKEECKSGKKRYKDLTGKQKAAILLISLGPDVCFSL